MEKKQKIEVDKKTTSSGAQATSSGVANEEPNPVNNKPEEENKEKQGNDNIVEKVTFYEQAKDTNHTTTDLIEIAKQINDQLNKEQENETKLLNDNKNFIKELETSNIKIEDAKMTKEDNERKKEVLK